MQAFEQEVIGLISWVRLGIEILGALVVVVGVVAAMVHVARNRRGRAAGERPGFHAVRLLLSQYLAVALEFQLAADILATTIAPSWAEIGKLAAVATIRTALNYFLEREMRSMQVPDDAAPRSAKLS